MNFQRLALVLIVALGIVGCTNQALLEQFASPEEQALAKGYLDLLRQRQFDAIEQATDPSLSGPGVHQALVRMAALLPTAAPDSVKLVGANRFKTAVYSTVNLSYEYRAGGRWFIGNVVLKKQGTGTTILGFHVTPQSSSLEEQNKFALSGRTPFQYLMLVLAIALPIFMIATLVVCIRTKWHGKKWPWVIFIMCGLGKCAVNWSTGGISVNPLSLQLLGAGVASVPYGPVILSVSLPIGAIVFLVRRKALITRSARANDR